LFPTLIKYKNLAFSVRATHTATNNLPHTSDC
jgi:hypothetical protein